MSWISRFALIWICAGLLLGQRRQVSITIDDLPRGGDDAQAGDLASIQKMTLKLTGALRFVPVTGFVNPGRARTSGERGLDEILKIWVDHGLDLGNHSYSHPDLNETGLHEFNADVMKAEPALVRALGKRPVYFRHPFLHTGMTIEKKHGLTEYLRAEHYVVAPVTIDDADYVFAAVYTKAANKEAVKTAYLEYMDGIFAFFEKRSIEVVGREFAQILLIHANQLNADVMPDLLAMMKRRGYAFVSLQKALEDRAYQLPENYLGKGGISWIHRWGEAKGMKVVFEPEVPPWIAEEYKRLRP